MPGDEPDPVKGVGSSLERIAKRLGVTPEKSADLFERWPDLVGPAMAEEATPLGLVDGVLTVEVLDQRWATQFKWLAPQLTVKINEQVGEGTVKRIELRKQSRNHRS